MKSWLVRAIAPAGFVLLFSQVTGVHAEEFDLHEILRSGYCWEKYKGVDRTDKNLRSGVDLAYFKDSDVYIQRMQDGHIEISPKKAPYITYRAVPCPQPDLPPHTLWGWEFGAESTLALSYLFNIEHPALLFLPTLPTFQSSERATGVAGGAVAMVTVPTGVPNTTTKLFASIDVRNDTVQHVFANGNTLGTTSNVLAEAGVKSGVNIANGGWLYGLAAVAALNETLRVNFAPVNSSTNTTVAGAAVGAGYAFKPSFLRGASLFVEVQHLWYQDAHFNQPPSSPGFNYTFRREDTLAKLGITFALGGLPSAAPAPTYPVKALPPK